MQPALAQGVPALPAAPMPPAPPAATAVPVAPPSILAQPEEVSGPYKAYLYQRYANDQEARGVVHLFGRKQTGGMLWLLGGTTVTAYLASQTGTHASGTGTYTFTVSPLGYGILVGLTAGLGGGKLLRFNNQRLYEALLAHEQGGRFPDYVERKLRPRDFR